MSEEQTDGEPDGPKYNLVMPFICCKGNGGELDPHAFVAGCVFGSVSTKLMVQPMQVAEYVTPDMVAQYDLLAMDRGYTLTAEPWDEYPDEWVLITLTRGVMETETPA